MGLFDFLPILNCKVFSTGQASMHKAQAVHSSEIILNGLWTLIKLGQTLVHFRQSVQLTGLRVTLTGLNKLRNPSSAPYGQR